MAGTGDVNGDGTDDFIVGAPNVAPNGVIQAGSAYIYSGATGEMLYQKDGDSTNDQFGQAVAGAGDINGDGKADFIVGAYAAKRNGLNETGSVYVFSGVDGSLLFEKTGINGGSRFGFTVVGAGDVDGDGKADFIVGAPDDPNFHTRPGSAYVYSGEDGSLLYEMNGDSTGDQFGLSVASAGDINEDGKAEFIVGAPYADPDGLNTAGSVYVYSGADGSLLYRKNGAIADDGLGFSVNSSGDVNGDGSPDFIIGAWFASPNGLSGAGSVFVYSGSDGSLLYQKNGAAAGDGLGISVASAGDVDRDNKADFILGAPFTKVDERFQAGSAFVYSGADGSLLIRVDGVAANNRLGRSVAGVGRVENNLRGIIIGAYQTNGDAGSAYVFTRCTKGNLNCDDALSPADVVLMLNCVFLDLGNCDLCFADVTCNGTLSPSDVVVELNAVFLNEPICSL